MHVAFRVHVFYLSPPHLRKPVLHPTPHLVRNKSARRRTKPISLVVYREICVKHIWHAIDIGNISVEELVTVSNKWTRSATLIAAAEELHVRGGISILHAYSIRL